MNGSDPSGMMCWGFCTLTNAANGLFTALVGIVLAVRAFGGLCQQFAESLNPERLISPPGGWGGGPSNASLDFGDPSRSPGPDWQWRGSGPPGSSKGHGIIHLLKKVYIPT